MNYKKYLGLSSSKCMSLCLHVMSQCTHIDWIKIIEHNQGATFEKRDNAHPPGWLVGLEIQQKKSKKIGDFFADKSLGFSFRLNHAGVTGADRRHLNDLLLLLKIPVQAVEDTLY